MKIPIFNGRYLFSFKLGFSLLCLFFFVVFCSLGAWQLCRYYYKKELVHNYEQRLVSTPKAFTEVMHDSEELLQFQPIRVEGEYVNELTVFIQNKQRNDKVGFEVLTPFRIKDENKLLLVDKGWVEKIDEVTAHPAEKQQINGYIKLLNEYQFILGNNIVQRNPLLMQKINISELSQISQQAFFPYILRLDASQADGYNRQWTIVAGVPQRHLGYAFQWFAMALIVFIGYFCFSCERKNGKR